jgi:antitoxin FitA
LQQLKLRAARNHRSMETEARAIMSAVVRVESFGTAWLEATAPFRGSAIPVPERRSPETLT